jgi:tRNA(adenine34) deaminase
MKKDTVYMQQALVLANTAADQGEIPVGALIVSPYGEVLGTGMNYVERYHCQRHHAEVRAIEQACKKLSSWHLDGCTLYVTLEPCMMCISLCALSRIERVVYGAESPIFGYHLDKEGVLSLYKRQIKNITSGVLGEEAAAMLKDFFKHKRGNSDAAKS